MLFLADILGKVRKSIIKKHPPKLNSILDIGENQVVNT